MVIYLLPFLLMYLFIVHRAKRATSYLTHYTDFYTFCTAVLLMYLLLYIAPIRLLRIYLILRIFIRSAPLFCLCTSFVHGINRLPSYLPHSTDFYTFCTAVAYVPLLYTA